MSLPEVKLNHFPIVPSNFDHKLMASKSGNAPAIPPSKSTTPFFLKLRFVKETAQDTAATPENVCERISNTII